MLVDLAAERMVLTGTAASSEAFLDVDYNLRSETFTNLTNQVVWNCIKNIRSEDLESRIDLPLLRSKAKELNLDHVVEDPDELEYVRSLLSYHVETSNVRKFAAKIRKLEIGRLLHDQLEEAQNDILKIKGNENVDSIIALAENRLFDFTSTLISEEEGISHISEGADEYFEYLLNNEVDTPGIPSGFPIWDDILGGLRRQAVVMIGARSGMGKSIFSDNVALHVAGKLNIPTLYLDTEMQKKGHWDRLWANVSEVPSDDIERGRFKRSDYKKNKVKEAKDYVNSIPYNYVNISGKPFEETLAYIRRWLIRDVGYDENGKLKNCLVIYDYLKMMSGEGLSSEMKEYQLLGFQMTGLHNFAVKFDIPILSFVQLNRDGIDKENASVIAQSDRIVWLASSVTIFKDKSITEMADTAEEGNKKLIVIKNRFGRDNNSFNEYINLKFDGRIAKITEGKLSTFNPTSKKSNQEFEVVNNNDTSETNF